MKKTIVDIKKLQQKTRSGTITGNSNILTFFDNINIGILHIMDSAAFYKINEAECIVGEKNSDLQACRKIYQDGLEEAKQEHFKKAAEKFIQAFEIANCLVTGEPYFWENEQQIWTTTSYLILSVVILLVVLFSAVVKYRKKKNRILD